MHCFNTVLPLSLALAAVAVVIPPPSSPIIASPGYPPEIADYSKPAPKEPTNDLGHGYRVLPVGLVFDDPHRTDCVYTENDNTRSYGIIGWSWNAAKEAENHDSRWNWSPWAIEQIEREAKKLGIVSEYKSGSSPADPEGYAKFSVQFRLVSEARNSVFTNPMGYALNQLLGMRVEEKVLSRFRTVMCVEKEKLAPRERERWGPHE